MCNLDIASSLHVIRNRKHELKHEINLFGLFWFGLVFWKFRHLSPGGSVRAIFGLPDFFFWKRPPSMPLSRVRGGVFVFIVFAPRDMASTSRGRDGRDGWEDGTSLGGRAGTNYLPTLPRTRQDQKRAIAMDRTVCSFRFFPFAIVAACGHFRTSKAIVCFSW